MNKGAFSIAALIAAAALSLTGCSAKATPPVASVPNVSGDYSGTMQDSVGGSGTATATFAQTGSSAGGAVTDVETSGTITAQFSFKLASNGSTSGSMVIDYASGTTCTYSTSGTYDSTTGVLAGTYSATTNCSGESGSYSLTQQCTDTVTGHTRRDTSFLPC